MTVPRRSRSPSQSPARIVNSVSVPPDKELQVESISPSFSGASTPPPEASPSGREIATSPKKRPKKIYFIAGIATYLVICFLYFTVNLIMWIYYILAKMQYFIRSPNTTGFYTIVPDAFWFHVLFLAGSFLHLYLAAFTIPVLVGLRKLEKVVIRYHEKIMVK